MCTLLAAFAALRRTLPSVMKRKLAWPGLAWHGMAIAIAMAFGVAGLLRERIEKGNPAQAFAYADMQHPAALAASDD